MKRFVFALSLGLATIAATPPVQAQGRSTNAYRVQVTSIYDGDTFSVNLPGLPTELNPVKIRLRGVDTPERGGKAQCQSERTRAEQARAFTVQQIATTRGQVIISNLRWDKYGGRVDADVYVGTRQENLTDLLVVNGYGRVYDGGKRKGWCF